MINRRYFFRAVNGVTGKSATGIILKKSIRPDPWGVMIEAKEHIIKEYRWDLVDVDITDFNRV